jgi:hypothetical protein
VCKWLIFVFFTAMGLRALPNDGLPGRVEAVSLPAEFDQALSIEQQAERLSATSRERFLATVGNGAYDDDESKTMLLAFYKIQDEILKLEALEKETGGPVVLYRGRMIPNPLRKSILDQYRELGRFFRLLGLDQLPRGDDGQGSFFPRNGSFE